MAVIDRFSGVDHFFLSNFSFDRSGLTLEHFYQAAKTDDPHWIESIMSSRVPREAKRLGQLAPLREDWDEVKLAVMRTLLFMKFSHPQMSEKLIATGDAVLIEGNDWGDTYWGVCNGVGENHLGKLLMQVRAVLILNKELRASKEDR